MTDYMSYVRKENKIQWVNWWQPNMDMGLMTTWSKNDEHVSRWIIVYTT